MAQAFVTGLGGVVMLAAVIEDMQEAMQESMLTHLPLYTRMARHNCSSMLA